MTSFFIGALFVSCAVPSEIIIEKEVEEHHDESDGGAQGQGGSIDFGKGGAGGVETMPSCATAKFDPIPAPLDLYVMMDRSGSMGEIIGETTKWKLIKDALGSFMGSPESSGIGLGIGFFPVVVAGMCEGQKTCVTSADCGDCGVCLPLVNVCSIAEPPDSCIVDDYSSPVVAIQTLPEAQQTLENAIEATGLLGQTPLSAAFDGAKNYATTWATAHPDHSVAIVLATDGYPSSCSSLGSIAEHAEAALEGEHPIKTFVIGVGDEVELLDSLAKAGGTKKAYLVAPNTNTGVEFAKALAEIRDSALGCTFELPNTSNGLVDFDKVNVSVIPSEGEPFFLPKVESSAKCGDSNSWYYDDESTPTKVLLCPKSCEENATERALEIVLGCETVIK